MRRRPGYSQSYFTTKNTWQNWIPTKNTHLGCFPLPSNREKQESSSFKYFWLVLYPVMHIFYLQLLTSLLGGDVSGITDLSDLLPVHPCRFWVLLRCVGKHRDLGLGTKTIVITKICLLGAWKNDKTYSPNGGEKWNGDESHGIRK